MYAVINEYDHLDDGICGAEVVATTDTYITALGCAMATIAGLVSEDLDEDSWERVDIIEVESEYDAFDMLESGDYYDTGSMFHWDSSIK